ncbi:MAG: ATP-binding protein [Desulfobacterales bacterium]|nr:ATP-binding protein [Desulfobacterales bacterium]
MVAEQENNDLRHILKRVRQKTESYRRYNFSRDQDNLLKCFFDLAQEFVSLPDLYRICVAVPLEVMRLQSNLYLLDEEGKNLRLACSSLEGLVTDTRPVPTGIHPSTRPYVHGEFYVVPIFRRALPTEPVDLDEQGDDSGPPLSRLIGLFAVFPQQGLSESDRFFLVKYANRLGYRLYNRYIAQQNIRHLKFINSLVLDIEHNVIIPNMYFRYLFNQLQKRIVEIADLEALIRKLAGGRDATPAEYERVIDTVAGLRKELTDNYQEIRKHHDNVSLFLESLFRREHFQKGHLVLQPKRCLVEKEIIEPQLEQYRKRLENAGVTIDRPTDMVAEEFPILVDKGLLAQVYANFFSNAAKYTETIIDHHGRPRKAVAYGQEVLPDYFGPGQDGIKFNVFTTGPHLSRDDVKRLFFEGGRGRNSEGRPGTGHGLAFVKHVIEMHGGTVGYEETAQGNNFYVILPLPSTRAYSLLPMIPEG